MHRIGRLLAISVVLLVTGCSESCEAQPPVITLATTTSALDSGLLDALLPLFERQVGINVKVVAVGSGQALELGRRGDADVLLTHAPRDEEQFMAAGHGRARFSLMHNEFVVVGPAADPASVRGAGSAAEAFRRIAASGAPFVSRGDESGTYQRERQIWAEAEIEPEGDWYIQAGSGMAAALRMAGEKDAYTLSDRGTFLSLRRSLDLHVQFEGDPLLVNQYSVILVAPQPGSQERSEAAAAFARFLRSPQAQDVIAEFGVERFGEPLFVPDDESPASAEAGL